MNKRRMSIPLMLMGIYCIVHGIFYVIGAFLLQRYGMWNQLFTFLFGNVSVSSTQYASFILGAAYVVVGICLMATMHWARLALLLLCVQSIFFEFPVGSILSLLIVIYLFTPSVSKMFPPIKAGHSTYSLVGAFIIIVGVFLMLVVAGVTTSITRFTSFQLQGFEASENTPESKIESVEQRVGRMDVLLELTGSTDYALEQQDIVLSEIAPYINRVVSRITRASNFIIVNVEASKLLKIAENRYISRICPVQPSFQFLPCQFDGANISNFAPLQLEVSNLWEQGITGKGVTIAVMDTGIKEDHPDLQRDGKSIVVGSLHLHGEYVYEHGTMVASCIANQDPQNRGIAPDVNILNVEVFRWETVGGVRYLTATNADILQGFEFVANWKKLTGDYIILSCSWGVSAQSWAHDADIAVAAANRLATEYNIPVVAAAGNSGPGSHGIYTPIPFQVMSPAGGKNVLSVGAVDRRNTVAGFSSRGPYYDGLNKPDVVAPGVDVPVLDYTGITTASGTSFACPYVSGIAALLVQDNTDLSSTQLYDAIRIGATDLGAEGYDLEYGYGVVNAEKSRSIIDQTVTADGLLMLFVGIVIAGMVIAMYPIIQKKMKK